MNGRGLTTTEAIITLVSPDSEDELATITDWADRNGIDVYTVDVGNDIEPVYDPDVQYLGVTLGGDGTFLEGVRQFAPREVPLLGVNSGHLAFLATISPADITGALEESITGQAAVDIRQQLHVDAPGVDSTGINDVMLEHEPPENPFDRKISRLQVFVDDEFIGEYEGSGVAVSTPTGSTGVSMSAGGPIHFPKNNESLQIVPLHTHRMGVRPLVVDAGSTIEIVPVSGASLLVDGGRAQTTLEEEDLVTITGAETDALVVNTSYDDSFFTSVSEKLGWSVRDGKTDVEAPSAGEPTDVFQTDEADDFLEHTRNVAIEAARAVGPPLRELHGRTGSVETKTDKADIVTEADYKADEIITTVLESEFPDHGIRSEESEEKVTDSEYVWSVDPVDGTGNYANGNPNYAVSIALLENEQPVMGVVYAPETDEMFTAIRGRRAYLNGEGISTTARDALEESVLLSGYDPKGDFLRHCYDESRGIRRIGSAALNLCYLARGSADAVWEYDTYPWDVNAGVVIARAAGATITDTGGKRFDPNADTDGRTEMVASNGPLHDSLLEHLDHQERLRSPEPSNDE